VWSFYVVNCFLIEDIFEPNVVFIILQKNKNKNLRVIKYCKLLSKKIYYKIISVCLHECMLMNQLNIQDFITYFYF